MFVGMALVLSEAAFDQLVELPGVVQPGYQSCCLLFYWQMRCELPDVCISYCLLAVVTRFGCTGEDCLFYDPSW